MKNLFFFAVAAVLTNVASADFVPGRVRPVMRAQLEYVEGPTTPRAESLSLNKMDGSSVAHSFTLVEDTGVRCITIPCPSSTSTEFIVEKITHRKKHDFVRYEAVEVLKNIPPHVRMSRRKLVVTQSSMELVAPGGGGFFRRNFWNVEVHQFGEEPQLYQGEPEYLMVTMDLE